MKTMLVGDGKVSSMLNIFYNYIDCSVQTVRVVEPNKSVAVGRDVVCSLILIIVWFWIYITLDLVPYRACSNPMYSQLCSLY